MAELNDLVEYLSDKPRIMQAKNLELMDWRVCFMLRNSLTNSSDISSHPEYRNQIDIFNGVLAALRSMRDEIIPIFTVRHKDIKILPELKLAEVITELRDNTISSFETAKQYLADLHYLVYASLHYHKYSEERLENEYEPTIAEYELLLTISYLVMIGANHLVWSTLGKPVMEGIDVHFDKPKK